MMRWKNYLLPTVLGFLFAAQVALIFYKSIWGMVPGAAVGVYAGFEALRLSKRREERRKETQFMTMLTSIRGALEAGLSLENSFRAALKDCSEGYGENAPIAIGIARLIHRVELNISIDDAMREFARELGIKEAVELADIIMVINRTGGNTVRIIQETSDRIIAGLQLRAELETTVAARRLEQRIMTFMPALILIFLRGTAGGLTDPLYMNAGGRIVMTGAVGLNVLADHLGKKILKEMEEGI